MPTGWQFLPNTPNAQWNLLHELFGETPNRATGTVALPLSNSFQLVGRGVQVQEPGSPATSQKAGGGLSPPEYGSPAYGNGGVCSSIDSRKPTSA